MFKEPTNVPVLIDWYNEIIQKVDLTKPSDETLRCFTDQELFIFVIGETFKFGRTLEASITNARLHMQNKPECIKIFTKKDLEKI